MSLKTVCRSRLVGIALFGVLAAACTTSYAPAPDLLGSTPSEVIARLGAPWPQPPSLEGVVRLDFPRGPFGKHTYVVYFGADGRAVRFEQVLDERNFARIRPGMSTEEVQQIIGWSRDTFLLARNRGFVWNYRYVTPLCQWFQIEFNEEGKVRSAGYGLPPECRRKFFGAGVG